MVPKSLLVTTETTLHIPVMSLLTAALLLLDLFALGLDLCALVALPSVLRYVPIVAQA